MSSTKPASWADNKAGASDWKTMVAFWRVSVPGSGEILADRVEIADTFFRRFRGLMWKKELLPGEGLLLMPCKQIHMFFMRFPIDAIFLDQSDRVVHCYQALQPWWGISGYHSQAAKVLEISAETVSRVKIQPGDQLKIETIVS